MIDHKIRQPDLVTSTAVHILETDYLEASYQKTFFYKQDKLTKKFYSENKKLHTSTNDSVILMFS